MLDESVALYEDFKFVIAFENSFTEGYWTEKMINAVLAGSIPIVGGVTPEPFLATYMNPKRFIYCVFDPEAFSTRAYDDSDPEQRIRRVKHTHADALAECVDKIRRVDQNDTLHEEMVNTPLLYNNTVENSIFDIRRIGRNIRQLLVDHQSYLTSGDSTRHN